MSDWKKNNSRFLGCQVKVTLDHDGPVIAQGKLLGFGEDGEFEILCEDGFVHYCWPMLEIEPCDVA